MYDTTLGAASSNDFWEFANLRIKKPRQFIHRCENVSSSKLAILHIQVYHIELQKKKLPLLPMKNQFSVPTKIARLIRA